MVVFLALGTSVARGQEMFAGYDGLCGLPVVVGADPQVATARTDAAGRKFIHIDPAAMSNWSYSRLFTLAHECGHHLLGHTSALGHAQRYMGGTRRQELEADCFAARHLMAAGLINDITRTMILNASQGHFAGGGYPSGVERASMVQACANGVAPEVAPVCRDVVTPCQHAAHPADVGPCGHGLMHASDLGPWGPMPCQHPFHPMGDANPCQHPQHPLGDVRRVCE